MSRHEDSGHGRVVRTSPKPILAAAALAEVTITPGFWAERLRLNREKTVLHAYRQLLAVGSIEAFRLNPDALDADGRSVFKRRDCDVGKWIEAASLSLIEHPDRELQSLLDQVVDRVVSAQQPDGYLNTYFTVVEPENRWTDEGEKQELYDAGHLTEAAVAYFRATGKRSLLDAMCRYADHIATVFGLGTGQLRGYPGHPELELALVKLADATGETRFLELARYFIDERGQQPCFFDTEAAARGDAPPRAAWNNPRQRLAHLPVRDMTEAEGHAVRAGYLYAGMADVAAATGDAGLLAACRRIWRNIVERRLYIHGGVGSDGYERFTLDYDLPNTEAYAETCASIALVFFGHRMLQIEPHREFADVIERCLFNTILACASQAGDRFFYANRLACAPDLVHFRSSGAIGHGHKHPDRQPWFGVACCPTNLARFLPGLGQYIYSRSTDRIWIHQYINSAWRTASEGHDLSLRQSSAYPWHGTVNIELTVNRPTPLTLCMRLPGWCERATIRMDDGEPLPATAGEDGYIRIEREWRDTTRVTLTLDMPVQRIEAHPAVDGNAGRIALQRGPVLFCLEEKDNGKHLHDILLPLEAEIAVAFGDAELGDGVPVLSASARRRDLAAWSGRLYGTRPSPTIQQDVRAIPYYLWNNRGEGEMLVWMRETETTREDDPA